MSFETSFVWAEPGFLAFGEKPGLWRALEDDLAFLQDQGISVIVSMLEDHANLADYEACKFSTLHFPVLDLHAPTQDQIRACLKEFAGFKEAGKKVYLHCYGGLGRSATIAAAWLIHSGMAPADAVRCIQRMKAGTIETECQVNCLFEFGASR
jgi:protein-tyrosine phosphatase